MKNKIILIVFCFISTICHGQTLSNMEKLVWGISIDSAENLLSKWGYKFFNTKKDTTDNIITEIVVFKKEDEYISLFKNKTDVMKAVNFDVKFITYSSEKYQKLKDECFNMKGIHFLHEDVDGNSYIRYYQKTYFQFKFTLFGNDNPVYTINIYFSFLFD